MHSLVIKNIGSTDIGVDRDIVKKKKKNVLFLLYQPMLFYSLEIVLMSKKRDDDSINQYPNCFEYNFLLKSYPSNKVDLADIPTL